MPDPQDLGGVPANVASLIRSVGIIPPKLLEDDANEMLEPLREGYCMTCKSPLGRETILLVNSKGVVAGYCGGPCMQDMAVLGWITEAHDDIMDNIKFRGGKGDIPEEE